mgnify:CR=1 FL=1
MSHKERYVKLRKVCYTKEGMSHLVRYVTIRKVCHNKKVCQTKKGLSN